MISSKTSSFLDGHITNWHLVLIKDRKDNRLWCISGVTLDGELGAGLARTSPIEGYDPVECIVYTEAVRAYKLQKPSPLHRMWLDSHGYEEEEDTFIPIPLPSGK